MCHELRSSLWFSLYFFFFCGFPPSVSSYFSGFLPPRVASFVGEGDGWGRGGEGGWLVGWRPQAMGSDRQGWMGVDWWSLVGGHGSPHPTLDVFRVGTLRSSGLSDRSRRVVPRLSDSQVGKKRGLASPHLASPNCLGRGYRLTAWYTVFLKIEKITVRDNCYNVR